MKFEIKELKRNKDCIIFDVLYDNIIIGILTIDNNFNINLIKNINDFEVIIND